MSAFNNINRCGYIAILGRPNVGKSTLLNYILGQKISITSDKPQTTRHQVLGIKTSSVAQSIYVDTPGLHQNSKKAMNRYMNRAASSIINDVDIIVFVVDALNWTDEDQSIVDKLIEVNAPVILVVNKIDKLGNKNRLLPALESLSSKMDFTDIIPVSAKRGSNVDRLENIIERLLPESPAFFPEEQVTDKSEKFLAAELIREKLMRKLGAELPYALTVEIERFSDKKDLISIDALVWVERPSQKSIVIGKNGSLLKSVGKQARQEMEKMFDKKVFLQLWVKVKEKWSDDERMLRLLGYTEQ
ncbi:MAG: GTPase Era [Gammaproteobacteria bacterium]